MRSLWMTTWSNASKVLMNKIISTDILRTPTVSWQRTTSTASLYGKAVNFPSDIDDAVYPSWMMSRANACITFDCWNAVIMNDIDVDQCLDDFFKIWLMFINLCLSISDEQCVDFLSNFWSKPKLKENSPHKSHFCRISLCSWPTIIAYQTCYVSQIWF